MAVFTGYNFYIMKNFSLIVVGILFIYCVSSCRKQVDKGFEMTVDLSISNPYLPMSVLVDTIESVRLQLPSPYFWGMVDNVISKDSCYYISDRKQEMAFRFSKNGTFLNAIGQRGEGPGEYREMDSFIDEMGDFDWKTPQTATFSLRNLGNNLLLIKDINPVSNICYLTKMTVCWITVWMCIILRIALFKHIPDIFLIKEI
jgi:hypothetical protein